MLPLKYLLLLFIASPVIFCKETTAVSEPLVEGVSPVSDDVSKTNLPADDPRTDLPAYASKTDLPTDNDVLFDITPDASLTREAVDKIESQAERYQFQAEIARMMKLIVNSLYKNKEIFLRELISNAADALDKIRFVSIQQPGQLKSNKDLNIKIKSDPVGKTITITDTGIGMTKDDLIKNLGTIAESGTSSFFEKMMNSSNKEEHSHLIGQFGVGFYSVYLVADKVMVRTKHNNDSQYIWISDSSSFTISEDKDGSPLGRGTEITLYLRNNIKDFTDNHLLFELVSTYSRFIHFDILQYRRVVEMEREKLQKKLAEGNVEEDKNDIVHYKWKKLNNVKPIWLKKVSNVSVEEYQQFFETIYKSGQKALGKIHFHTEGDVSFKSILYIPPDLNENPKEGAIEVTKYFKLYVRRVFITDHFVELLPRYLSFIAGMIDSDDLPLNVSREILQTSKLLRLIKKKIIRKVLEMIAKLGEGDFLEFYKKFSRKLKTGVMEDTPNAMKIAKLLRYSSSNGENMTSLGDYVARMKKGQDKIYFLSGESIDEVKASPLLETVTRKGFEVVYLTDPIDETVLVHLQSFGKINFANLAFDSSVQGLSKLRDVDFKAKEEEFKPLIEYFKKNIVTPEVTNIAISKRLHKSASAYVTHHYGISGHRAKLLRAHEVISKEIVDQHLKEMRLTYEINAGHPVIKELLKLVNEQNPEKEDLINKNAFLISDTAKFASRYIINSPSEFAARIEESVRKNLNVSLDAQSDAEIEDKETVDQEQLDENSDKITEETSDTAEEKIVETEVKEGDKEKSCSGANSDQCTDPLHNEL
uniref:HATPase_c domain-containing protein n=1 Tax=Rhabditophanes sp. KR3021 TaxID=114890 RepID=A0AC35UGW9_9BILA